MDLGPIALLVAGLLSAWACLMALLWVIRPRDTRLADLVAVVPDVLRLVRDLLADRSTPFRVRLALLVLLGWLLSPIDLVPEFIPILGPLDDVVVTALVLRFVRSRVGTARLRQSWRGTDATFELLLRIAGGREPSRR